MLKVNFVSKTAETIFFIHFPLVFSRKSTISTLEMNIGTTFKQKYNWTIYMNYNEDYSLIGSHKVTKKVENMDSTFKCKTIDSTLTDNI